jgi:hypothetical protein
MGRAAALLNRTQPSISARIAALESAWKTRLFRRAARGMELTPEGARLLPGAESVLRGLEELDREAGLPVVAPGELRVGSGDALGRRLLPGALAKLLREQPELEIHLREGTGRLLIEALRDGEIDLALVVESKRWKASGSSPCSPARDSDNTWNAPSSSRGWNSIRRWKWGTCPSSGASLPRGSVSPRYRKSRSPPNTGSPAARRVVSTDWPQ